VAATASAGHHASLCVEFVPVESPSRSRQGESAKSPEQATNTTHPSKAVADIVVCVKGDQSFSTNKGEGDSGQGCLSTAVLYDIDRSMPALCCSIRVGDDAVLFGSSSMRDVANVVGLV
jgi:hypothetical protein